MKEYSYEFAKAHGFFPKHWRWEECALYYGERWNAKLKIITL